MTGPVRPNDRRWYERTVIAAMVIVGFAIGSLGLTVAAELLGDDPVLTDEFNAPVADDDADAVVAVAVTTTTTTSSPSAPPSTAPPSATEETVDERSRDDADRDRPGRGDPDGRSGYREERRRA